MPLKFLGSGLLLAVLAISCREPDGSCERDSDCGQGAFCDTKTQLCFQGESCAAPCPACTRCRDDSCTQAFQFQIQNPTPDAVVGGSLSVQVALVAMDQSEVALPDTLKYRLIKDGVEVRQGSLVRANEVYAADVTELEGGTYSLTIACAAWSQQVSFTVDRTVPQLSVEVPAPPTRTDAGGFAFSDPGAAFPHWRRDETVAVQVQSSVPVMTPSLTARVRGHGASTDYVEVLVTPSSGACPAAFCGVISVPLWKPSLNEFRGAFTLEVKARNTVGNEASLTREIAVTRWKWVFNGSSGPVSTTPAIGEKGAVYFGSVSDSESGKFFSLEPRGTKNWEVSLGAVAASPVVGAYSGGVETVYVAAKSSSSTALYALSSANGSMQRKCPGSGGSDTYGSGTFDGSLGLMSTPAASGNVESAVGVYGGTPALIASIQPGAASACSSFGTSVLRSSTGGSFVSDGLQLFYPTTNGRVTSYTYGSADPRSSWPVNVGFVPFGLAINGGSVVGAGGDSAEEGGLFSLSLGSGAPALSYRFPGLSSLTSTSRINNLVIGANNTAYFGNETETGGDVTAFSLISSTKVTEQLGLGVFKGAFAVGRSGLLYGSDSESSRVTAFNASDLHPRWQVTLAGSAPSGSLTLDCARDAQGTPVVEEHGVLYVPGMNGRLYALVVDSRGLDPLVPWPKFQRDARNTGNVATPISNCP